MKNEHRVALAAETFDQLRFDADLVLNKLIKNMAEKDAMEGNVTIKIDVSLLQEYVPRPKEEQEKNGDTRRILKPKFEHKISSTMQIKDSKSGTSYSDTMEMVWDDDKKEYVLIPIRGAAQMSIFDFENKDPQEPDETKQIEGHKQMALPMKDDAEEEPEDPDVIDAEFTEVDPEDEAPETDKDKGSRAAFEKARAKFSGMNEPIEDPEDYEYEDPEEAEDE